MGLFGWAAALNPVAMLGNALTFGGDYLLQQEQNQANKELWEKQRDFAVDMWNRQNAYNTPTSQMQRLRDAGLNPNLAYGQVADSKAALVGSPTPPTMGRVSAPSLVEYQQVVNMQEQNRLIRAQAKKAEAEAAYSAYETEELKKVGGLKSDTGSWPGLLRYLFRNVHDRANDLYESNKQRIADQRQSRY